MDMGPILANASLDLVHLGKIFTVDFTKEFVSFTALTKFMDNQKTHVVEGEFFEFFCFILSDLLGLKPNKIICSLQRLNKCSTSWNKNV